MRKKMVVGNWKMNTSVQQGLELFEEMNSLLGHADVLVGVACPSTHIFALSNASRENEHWIEIGAQDCSDKENGAYTGEISGEMIRSAGGSFALVGHSERRKYHRESGEILKNKIEMAVKSGLGVIYCLGESLEQRKSGQLYDIISGQLEEGPFQFSEKIWSGIALAYEPVWAIGTGETASPLQAQEVHAFIRKSIAEKYSERLSTSTTILYGGSCKPANAKELFSQKDIDGGLIGGASLKAKDFNAIIHSF